MTCISGFRLAALALALIGACTAAPVAPSAPVPSLVTGAPPSALPPASGAPSIDSSRLVGRPTGSGDVLLRMHRRGGFLWPGTTADLPPIFTLYGDGAVIYGDADALGGSDPQRGLRLARMDEEQIAALIAFALGPGGLAEAAPVYDDVPVADATGITFTVNAAGTPKTVSVYALDEGLDEPGPETAHRQRFLQLFELLNSFAEQVARGNATDAGPYEPTDYRVTLFQDTFDELQVTGEWPWDDLEPSDFEQDQSGFGVGVIAPEQAAALARVPTGEMGDPVVVGPDDKNYLIRLRPLLPDEIE